jgi:hypothetical protein
MITATSVLAPRRGSLDIHKHITSHFLFYSLFSLFGWLAASQPTVLFFHIKSVPVTCQPAVFFSHNKSAPAIIQSNKLLVSHDSYIYMSKYSTIFLVSHDTILSK